MNVKDTITTLIRDGLILVFNQDKLDVVETARALQKAGVNNMEVTCRISHPLEKLRRLRRELPDFVAGAASLIDAPAMLKAYNEAHPQDPLPSLEEVVEAGACYLVSAANFRDESHRAFAGAVPLIPGCGSVTEIVRQFSMGANLCKVFPAQQLGGPAFVKAIDPAIHKMISLVPTGGTNATNIPEYVAAGILTFGGSFSMIDKPTLKRIIDGQDYDLLAGQLAEIKQLIDRLRQEAYPDLDLRRATLEQISRRTGRRFNVS